MKQERALNCIGNVIATRYAPRRTSRLLSTACLSRANQNPLLQPPLRRAPPKSPASHLLFRQTSTASKSSKTLRKTPLYDLHCSHGAKMVPFGGYHMPVQYDGLSVSASHHFTRSHASLFDVSHMVQHHFIGPGAVAFLQRVTPAGLSSLPEGSNTLSTLLWPGTGGIVDDTIITRLQRDELYVVTNAACREKDLKYFTEELESFRKGEQAEVEWKVMDGWGLVALQGPLSKEILESVVADVKAADLEKLYFGQSKSMKFRLLDGSLSGSLLVTRGGYTGEDGFEISITPEETVAVTEALLKAGPQKVQLAGLGARDSLRLEAGMCLYGHDLDDTTTPVEGALSWIIGKDRKHEGGFHGADIILQQMKPKSKGGIGVERRRVGLVVDGAPAREGADIVNERGEKIGNITSGCPSPTLEKNIAMAYIKDGFHKAGTEVEVVVRNKKRKAQVTKMPFVASKYWKVPM